MKPSEVGGLGEGVPLATFGGVGVFYGFCIADKIGAANSVGSVGAVDADWHSGTLAPLAMFCPFVARFLLL